MTEANEVDTRRRSGGRLVLGLFLIAIGGLLLAGSLGFEVPRRVWSYWPLLLIGLGAVKLLWPGTADDRRGGYWLTVIGLWGAINVFDLFGLHWGNSWPLLIIAAGLLVAVEAALGRRLGAGGHHAT